jgi:large subunit ribosomal protein L31
MKQDRHPKWYPEARVICACGNTWVTGSTVPEIRTDVCSACHPFYTGEQRIVDTEGQVDRFMKRLKAREERLAVFEARQKERDITSLPITELELGSRYEKALAEAGLTTVGQVAELLKQGDDALLAIKGFGLKALIDLKRRLRARGFEIAAEQEA